MEARELAQPPSRAFSMALRVRHPSIDPADISRELQIEAEHSFGAGQPRRTRQPAVAAESVHGETYWLGTVDVLTWATATFTGDPGWLEPRIPAAVIERLRSASARTPETAMALLVHFLRKHAAFAGRIRAEGGRIDLLLAIEAAVIEGFTLAPEVSRVLHEMDITLEISFAPG